MNLSLVQSLSHVWLFVIPWTISCQASLSFTISQSLLQLLSIESVMPSSLLVLSLPSPSAYNSSSIRVFSNESAVCIRWPEYWSVSISLPAIIQGWFPLELTGLISLLSKGLSRVSPAPWFENINYFTLRLLMVQLSHPYITTGKTMALTICTFTGKVMSPLSNMLSRFVIAFFPKTFHSLYRI